MKFAVVVVVAVAVASILHANSIAPDHNKPPSERPERGGAFALIEHKDHKMLSLEGFPDTVQWGTEVALKVKLYYELEKSSNPDAELMVLVHPTGAYTNYWDGVIQSFKDKAVERKSVLNFHLLSVDIRGAGRSENTPGPFSIPTFAADLEALIQYVQSEHKIPVAKVHLVGNSVGAATSMQFTLDYPDLVGSLAYSGYKSAFFADWMQWFLGRRSTVSTLGMSTYGMLINMACKVRPEHKATMREIYSHNLPEPYAKISSAWDGFNVTERLLIPQVPVLLLYPEYDSAVGFSVEEMKRDAETWSDCTFKEVSGEGHFYPFESPAKYVADLLEFHESHGIKTFTLV